MVGASVGPRPDSSRLFFLLQLFAVQHFIVLVLPIKNGDGAILSLRGATALKHQIPVASQTVSSDICTLVTKFPSHTLTSSLQKVVLRCFRP